jgi:hypothetical protein
MGKGEMGTARAGKPPSLPRKLRTPLVYNKLYWYVAIASLSMSICQ